mgnify:CR=1 FL=1
MNHAITAVIKKDFRAITANRRLFLSLLIVPLVLTVFVPGVFISIAHFMPEDEDIQMLLELLPRSSWASTMELTVTGLIFNNILPVFFLMIPIMASSIMAASSFVGEKEKHTLETLLYSPLSLGQIFRAKILASFLMSMTVSLISFAVMLIVVEVEVFLLMGTLLIPSASWLVILLLLSPAVSLIAVTLIVRGSAKAQSMEESQQGAVFMILPVLLLIVGQFTGVLLVSVWILLGLSLLCMLLALFLLKRAAGRFTYEMLLK